MATVAAGPADCPMLRILLGRGQRDCPFALSWLLMFNDLAVLYGTCHGWRTWICECPLRVERFREVTPYVLPKLVDCAWARPRIVRIRLMPVDAELPPNEHRRLLEESLPTCARLPKLMQLQLHTASQSCAGNVLRTAFVAMPRLILLERETSPLRSGTA